ncbi:1-aminocyclopropane-1-carboxylate oxidase homolog 4-like [Mangifera indica]|uniref:1-aminocyclopropane-1-carboxylate oxidase homolog 4-like n=1 Tax=Mangifera indica TaxID=29780 RepID=UPI001CFACB36|nr:1-aminocyclopropane-1-carboxylate oxidase homolog 4-like [Mangifera indica]
MNTQQHSHDRLQELKNFDDAKLGVKGLVDSGITAIPRFFIHPPETLSDLKRPGAGAGPESDIIPTIDLSGAEAELRSSIVEKIGRASRELGFFQVVNHGIEVEVLERLIGGIKAFHEQPTEMKALVYRREMNTGVSFFSNVDLYQSKAASWRDTLQIRLGPTLPELDEIPEICRKKVVEWNEHVKPLGELLMGLLCEGLGVESGRLKEMTFSEGRVMVAHYYPYCPQPDLTVGITSHTDPGALTILLQGQVGGLQVKYGEEWVDVKPIPGALVINIGDIFQILSNDEYRSVEHRVLANPSQEPRISVAVFFNSSDKGSLRGPLPELISPEKPAVFRHFTHADYMRRFFTKELDGKSLVNYYRLSETE